MSSQSVSIVFLVICIVSVLGKPLSIDVFENKDVLAEKKSVKRTTEPESGNDVAELISPKISLSAFLDNLESSLVRTALSAGSVASDPNAHVEQIIPTPDPTIIKRSIVEMEEKPVVLVQTTEKVSAADAVPAHVVIDRVSVFRAPLAGAALLPTFHFQEAPVAEKNDDVDVQVETTSIPAAEDSSESESLESTEESKEASSTTSVSLSSTTPFDEKKAAEKELKEKVAEVEADPVILTARV